ncbi:MAG: tetratricopeptide repeat protein [bacterium]
MLRPKKHITKQKIKEDQFVTRTLETAEWARKNQRYLIGGFVALVLVGVVIAGSLRAAAAAEERASLLTLQAGYAIDAGETETARALLNEAIQRFGGTDSAGRATVMMAGLLFQEGAVDSARTFYQRYLDRHGDVPMLRSASRAGIAACTESAGDFAEAARLYEEAAEARHAQPGAPIFLLQAGRCYRNADMPQEAMRVYERIKNDFPDFAEADRAAIELAALAHKGG